MNSDCDHEHCQCDDPRLATEEEQRWIDEEVGECNIIVATINDEKGRVISGIATLPKLSIKAAVVLPQDAYSDYEAREIIEMLARTVRAYYIRTRLAPLILMDEEASIQ